MAERIAADICIIGAGPGGAAVVARPNGTVLGVSILGEAARNLIGAWAIAIAGGARLDTMASALAPYPSFAQASIEAAEEFALRRFADPRLKHLVRFLVWFG